MDDWWGTNANVENFVDLGVEFGKRKGSKAMKSAVEGRRIRKVMCRNTSKGEELGK